ncbi:MAG: DNA polymerase III subunit delta [Alphaproteobacteria bacterium]|nr:DNA polymerase III subunit delta [Alphaproteobacteria bacterium]
MKAKPYQVTSLVPQIQNGFKGALIFGPDFGVVQEISEKIASFIVPDISDAFGVIKITPQKIKEIPSILLDEGNAGGLFGGRKILWLKNADNAILNAVEDYLDHIQNNTFLLITADNLTKNSALRVFCESHPNILCVACYADSERDVAEYIRETLSGQGIRISNAAMPMLMDRLGENRISTKKELEKLITYLGDKKTVEEADVMAVVTDTQNSSVDLFCSAVAMGNQKMAEKEYQLMLANGENPVGIIRILYLYFNKLLDAVATAETQGIDAGIKKIMKPAQFRMEAGFRKQLTIWKKSFVLKVLDLLLETEKQAKSTGFPIEIILGRIIIQITHVAQRKS